MKKISYKFINDYYTEHLCILLVEEKDYKDTRTRMSFICSCKQQYINTFTNFKRGDRCKECGIKKFKKTMSSKHRDVYNYYKQYEYTLKSIYTNCMTKDQLTCPSGHDIQISLNNFKTKNTRCRHCFFENNKGLNNPNFNPNREEITLNHRLRKSHSKEWIINNMKDDPNYEDFLNNQNNYVIDHIIPVSLFCKLFIKYNLNEDHSKEIINRIDNLQLLTCENNYYKYNKGTLFEAAHYLINNGVSILNFYDDNYINLQEEV